MVMHRFIAALLPDQSARDAFGEKLLGLIEKYGPLKETFSSTRFKLYTQKIKGPFLGSDLEIGSDYVFLGHVYSGIEIEALIEGVLKASGPELLNHLDGKYVYFQTEDEGLRVFRDPLGLKPLYSSTLDSSIIFSSEKKYLWSMGVEDVTSLTPNFIYWFEAGTTAKKKCLNFTLYSKSVTSFEDSIKQIGEILTKRVERLLRDVKIAAVAYSGGVDSSLTAKLASTTGKEVFLITTGLEGSRDLEEAVDASEGLDLPIELIEKTEENVKKDINETVRLVEDIDLTKIGIGLPFLWISRFMHHSNLPVLLTGQGSDEVFAGYAKFTQIYREQGERTAEETILKRILDSYQINFERDEKVVSNHGVQLMHPLISPWLVEYTLRLPLSYRIETPHDEHRKIILRRVAERLGLPKEIAWKKKRALQYSTLTQNAIIRLAKSEGRSPQEYLRRIFRETFTIEWNNHKNQVFR